jgi:hypothetical protein
MAHLDVCRYVLGSNTSPVRDPHKCFVHVVKQVGDDWVSSPSGDPDPDRNADRDADRDADP